MNLGAPMISAPELASPTSIWSIEVKWHEGGTFTAVYTAEQAKEIARRIINFYGTPEKEPDQYAHAVLV